MDVDASDALHGLVPMQAAGAPKLRVHRPDFAPTLRAVVFAGGLRRCGAGGCQSDLSRAFGQEQPVNLLES